MYAKRLMGSFHKPKQYKTMVDFDYLLQRKFQQNLTTQPFKMSKAKGY